MFKFVIIVALAAMVAAKPGLLSTHSVISPVVVGHTIHTAPSAITHQSHTQLHSKTIVTPVLAPVVKSYVAAPVVHSVPVVSHVHHAVPVLKTVHAAPVVHTAQVLHSVPLVHSVHASPIAYGLHH